MRVERELVVGGVLDDDAAPGEPIVGGDLPLLDDKPAGDLDFQSQRLGLDCIVSLSFGLVCAFYPKQ